MMGMLMERIRVKFCNTLIENKKAKWISNAISAIPIYFLVRALFEYAVTIDKSILLEWLSNYEIGIEQFISTGPVVCAAIAVLSPALVLGVVAVLMVVAFFGLCPLFILCISLGMLILLATNNAVKVAIIAMPVAIITLTAEQMSDIGVSSSLLSFNFSILLLVLAIYASNKLDRYGGNLAIVLPFVLLGILFGMFGEIKGIWPNKNFWGTDNYGGYVDSAVNQYVMGNLKDILIILAVFFLIAMVFSKLIQIKKTKLAELPVDIRDAIAFAVCIVLLIAAKYLIPEISIFSFEGTGVLSIIVQAIVAYLVTRPIANCEPKVIQRDKPEKELSEEEKQALEQKKKKSKKLKLIIAGVIVVALAGAGFYVYNYSGLIYRYEDVSSSEFVGTWGPYYSADDSDFYQNFEVDDDVTVNRYVSPMGGNEVLTLNSDGSFEYSHYDSIGQSVKDTGTWLETEDGPRLWVDNLATWEFHKYGDYGYAVITIGTTPVHGAAVAIYIKRY